jgi:hypothetical protein
VIAPPQSVVAALARTVAGPYHQAVHTVDVTDYREITALVGVYMLLGGDRAVVHLGQAARSGGVAARVAEHLAVPARAAVTRAVTVLQLDEQTPLMALSAIEGQLATALGLSGRLPNRRWPRSTGWNALIASATTIGTPVELALDVAPAADGGEGG